MSNEISIPPSRRQQLTKLALLVVLVAIVLGLYLSYGNYLQLSELADRETQLRDALNRHPLLIMGVLFGVYVGITGASLPGATAMTLFVAWYLGFWRALPLISFASTAGATIAFLLSRYFLRDSLERRFGERLEGFNRALDKEGAIYLLSLRLMPTFPFFMINAVMGLTRLRIWTFWWVSQLGMLPGTCIYVYAGSRIPELKKISDEGLQAVFTRSQIFQITLALSLFALFPLVARWSLKRLRKTFNSDDPKSLDSVKSD